MSIRCYQEETEERNRCINLPSLKSLLFRNLKKKKKKRKEKLSFASHLHRIGGLLLLYNKYFILAYYAQESREEKVTEIKTLHNCVGHGM